MVLLHHFPDRPCAALQGPIADRLLLVMMVVCTSLGPRPFWPPITSSLYHKGVVGLGYCSPRPSLAGATGKGVQTWLGLGAASGWCMWVCICVGR